MILHTYNNEGEKYVIHFEILLLGNFIKCFRQKKTSFSFLRHVRFTCRSMVNRRKTKERKKPMMKYLHFNTYRRNSVLFIDSLNLCSALEINSGKMKTSISKTGIATDGKECLFLSDSIRRNHFRKTLKNGLMKIFTFHIIRANNRQIYLLKNHSN